MTLLLDLRGGSVLRGDAAATITTET